MIVYSTNHPIHYWTILPNGEIHIVLDTANMTTKLMTIATIVAAAMIAGIVATTTPMTAVYADESKTETELKCKGTNNLSGESSGANFIDCQIGDLSLGLLGP